MKVKSIYLDGLFYKFGGIGKYYSDLLKGFIETDLKIYTSVSKRFRKEFLKEFDLVDKINVSFVAYEKFSFRGFFEHSLLLKNLVKFVDVFIFPHINLPLYIPQNSIVVIHDFRPFTEYWDRGDLKRYILLYYYRRAVKNSKAIITISNFIKNEAIRLYPELENKIFVIYNPFMFCLNNIKFNKMIDGNYLLYVGDRKRHKNIDYMLKSFNLLKNKISHKLVIVGKKEKRIDYVDEYLKKSYVKDRVIEMTNVSDEELFSLYKFADLLIMPSLYEGFGRPPIEAVICDCPVILSDIPVFREIWGDKVIYFNPNDVNDMANKIYFILSNLEIRNNLLYTQKKIVDEFIQKNNFIEKFLSIIELVYKTDTRKY